MITDDLVFEYPLIRRLNNKIRIMCETEQNKNSSHIAEGLKSEYNARQVRILCEAIYFFLLCYVVFPLNFVKILFSYGQRYPLEISPGTGITDQAEFEYVIFIHRTSTLQNSSGVICLLISVSMFIRTIIVLDIYVMLYFFKRSFLNSFYFMLHQDLDDDLCTILLCSPL